MTPIRTGRPLAETSSRGPTRGQLEDLRFRGQLANGS